MFDVRIALLFPRRKCHPPHSAFTLIETMLAVLLMALLASAVSLSFSKPLQAARAQDAVELIRSCDFTARRSAINSNQSVRLIFDLSSNTLLQEDGLDLSNIRRQISLPTGCSIDAVKIDEKSISAGQAILDISPNGWSRTYALHLTIPADQWLIFSGLTGQMTAVQNESQIPTYSDAPRHNTD